MLLCIQRVFVCTHLVHGLHCWSFLSAKKPFLHGSHVFLPFVDSIMKSKHCFCCYSYTQEYISFIKERVFLVNCLTRVRFQAVSGSARWYLLAELTVDGVTLEAGTAAARLLGDGVLRGVHEAPAWRPTRGRPLVSGRSITLKKLHSTD